MAFVYPLAMPSSPSPSRMVMRAQTQVALSESPFTLEQQAQEHQGNRWRAEIELPRMERADAEEWASFYLKLRGRNGTFLLPAYGAKTARGVATGSPQVAGTGQTGPSLATFGWTASQTGILKAGDYAQVMPNYLKSPSAFDAADWTKDASGGASAPTVTPNVASPLAPDGTQTVDQIDFPATAGGQSSRVRQNAFSVVPAVPSQSFTLAFWLAASASVNIDILINDGIAQSSSNVALTTSLQFFTVSHTASATATQLSCRITQSASQAAKTVYAWGAACDSPQGARLYKNLADVNSDANGKATFDIWPRLRTANREAEDHARIIVASPVGLFRLASNVSEWDISSALHYGMGFSAVEAL
jgi:hypothetical protein